MNRSQWTELKSEERRSAMIEAVQQLSHYWSKIIEDPDMLTIHRERKWKIRLESLANKALRFVTATESNIHARQHEFLNELARNLDAPEANEFKAWGTANPRHIFPGQATGYAEFHDRQYHGN